MLDRRCLTVTFWLVLSLLPLVSAGVDFSPQFGAGVGSARPSSPHHSLLATDQGNPRLFFDAAATLQAVLEVDDATSEDEEQDQVDAIDQRCKNTAALTACSSVHTRQPHGLGIVPTFYPRRC